MFLSISPSIVFGNSAGVGASLSVGYSDGNWSFSAGIGYLNYGNYNGFGNGVGTRKSILAAYDDFHQRTGVIGFRSGDFKLRYENDGGAGIKYLGLGDKGDSYRTASLQLSVGEFSAGFNLFTGRRTLKDQQGEVVLLTNTTGEYGKIFKNGFVNEQGSPYRLGALTFAYKGYRIGVNSEYVRHAIQTRLIHDLIGGRAFKNMSWDWQGFTQYRTPNAFTSWEEGFLYIV